jgi:hypothetical protein
MIFGLLSDIFQYNLNILKDAITLIFLFSIIILFSIDLVLKGIIKNRITLNIIELFLIILIFSIRYI